MGQITPPSSSNFSNTPVYSHSKKNDDGAYVGTKLLIDHLQGVWAKANKNFFRHVDLGDQTVLTHVLKNICLLHDLGKYTTYFQDYLLHRIPTPHRDLRAHSAFGAFAVHHLLRQYPDYALIGNFLIKSHHRNLQNIEDAIYPPGSDLPARNAFEQQRNNLYPFVDLHRALPEITDVEMTYIAPAQLYRLFKGHLQKSLDIKWYFLTNYLFSLLIEADKLDASDTPPYSKIPIDDSSVAARLGHPTFPNTELSKMDQNELRNYVRAQVSSNLDREDILEKRIFTLTAPTGIGKTLTALDFALKLRASVAKAENHLPQIIYALPFINIIEQAVSEYEKTVSDVRIIAHYQLADIFATQEPIHDEADYGKQQMTWDTWQSDIVITTFVQFFETLIGNRNRLLKKFHHLAGSIVIVDEIQTVDISKLPLIGVALNYLAKFLNARVIIMTATQPRIFEIMSAQLPVPSIDLVQPFDLLTDSNEVFNCFNRTRIIADIAEPVTSEQFVAKFESRWTTGKNCLIVVNTVGRSIDIFRRLAEVRRGTGMQLYYLSTNITPIERKKRIHQIRDALKGGNCVLVSTQVVEAGVDLDFDMGFRDLGPIPSIVQVAGRINRENDILRKGAPLYVVDFKECSKIYGHATYTRAVHALTTQNIFEEHTYKDLVAAYFNQISKKEMTDFRPSQEIFRAMCHLNYEHADKARKNPKTVSDFKLIEDRLGTPIYIEHPDDPDATSVRQAFEALLRKELPKWRFDKEYKRRFNQRIVAVPDVYHNVVELKRGEGLSDEILWVKSADAAQYYDPETGFIRNTVSNENLIVSF